jgi:hypothetical protein
MQLAPIPYRLFINTLALLDAFISPLPAEYGRPFMVYAWKGSGYIPQPKGPSCPVIHREMDEMVTVIEIKTVLRQLGFNRESFLQVIENTRVDRDAATGL